MLNNRGDDAIPPPPSKDRKGFPGAGFMNINIKKMEDSQSIGVVYDISLDGTVVNALGMNVVSNTDG